MDNRPSGPGSSSTAAALHRASPGLTSLVHAAYSRALGGSTRSCYSTAERKYVDWCSANSISPFPASEEALCFFVVYQALFIQLPSVLKYLSGIRSAHIDRAIPWPDTTGWLRFGRILRFLKKKYGCHLTALPRRPITVDILEAFTSVLNFKSHDDRLFFAASCMAVFSFWRGTEFLFSKASDQRQNLLYNRFSWSGSGRNTGCAVRLLHTKTKWWRCDVVTRVAGTRTTACPVKAMAAYLSASSSVLTSSSFLFTLANGEPLSRSWMMAKTTAALQAAGLSDDRYCSFSWRGGGALSARRAGISDSTIKALGRWESNAFMFYLPTESSDLVAAQLALARSKPPAPRGRLAQALEFSSSSLFSEEDFGDLS